MCSRASARPFSAYLFSRTIAAPLRAVCRAPRASSELPILRACRSPLALPLWPHFAFMQAARCKLFCNCPEGLKPLRPVPVVAAVGQPGNKLSSLHRLLANICTGTVCAPHTKPLWVALGTIGAQLLLCNNIYWVQLCFLCGQHVLATRVAWPPRGHMCWPRHFDV